jgi:hypothetical protein
MRKFLKVPIYTEFPYSGPENEAASLFQESAFENTFALYSG